MKYINANIKSREELYHRMLNGEIFYILRNLDLYKVFYNSKHYHTPPFRVAKIIKKCGGRRLPANIKSGKFLFRYVHN